MKYTTLKDFQEMVDKDKTLQQETTNTLVCYSCGDRKSLSEFQKPDKYHKDMCIKCRKNRTVLNMVWRKFKVAPREYYKIVDKYNGRCAICGTDKKLVVDHDHNTNKIRGLLCYSCNTGIGLLQDDPNIIELATKYLRNEL